ADEALAERYGITPRMVRTIRGDRRLWPFMPPPPGHVPDWQLQAMARHTAKQIMTPERYAKGERVRLTDVGLIVEQDRGLEAVYLAAWKMLVALHRYEGRLPVEFRRRPVWLAHRAQWTQCEWTRHPAGRRVKPRAGAE